VKFYWPFAKTAFFLRLSLDVAIRFRNASNDCKDKSETASLSMKKSILLASGMQFAKGFLQAQPSGEKGFCTHLSDR
jgi:hypothetical protein